MCSASHCAARDMDMQSGYAEWLTDMKPMLNALDPMGK